MLTNEYIANEIFEKVDRFFEVNITSNKKFLEKFLYFRPYEDGQCILFAPGVMKGYVYVDYENTIYVPICDYEKDKVNEEEIVYIRVKSLICSIIRTLREKILYKYKVDNEILFVAKIFKDNYIISSKLFSKIFSLKYDSDRIELLTNSLVDTIYNNVL